VTVFNCTFLQSDHLDVAGSCAQKILQMQWMHMSYLVRTIASQRERASKYLHHIQKCICTSTGSMRWIWLGWYYHKVRVQYLLLIEAY
jgi:hypothetical protein